MYIFYINAQKLGTCSTILKDYQKGYCIIRVIMWGLFCLFLVVDITKNMHRPFFCLSVFISVCVFSVWPKTTPPLPVWTRDVKSLETPDLSVQSQFFRVQMLIWTVKNSLPKNSRILVFLKSQWIFTKIDHILEHKINFSNFKAYKSCEVCFQVITE